MQFLVTYRNLALAAAALSCMSLVDAHSWVERTMVIANNGTFVGAPGYSRGNVLRTNPSFNDGAMTNLLPSNGSPAGNKIQDSDPICKSTQQQQTQTDGSPRLKVEAGGMVAILYQENGHVTFPDRPPGKAPGSGMVYVYGTSDPKPDDKFNAIYGQWNADGSGGDKRGKLLTNQTFDDGQCYQVNGGPVSTERQAKFKKPSDALMGGDLWCQTDIKLPTDLPTGKPYAIYWIWNWDTQKGTAGLPNGLIERYTNCMDFDIVAGNNARDLAGASYIDGQPLNNAAVASKFKAMVGSASNGNSQGSQSSSAPQQNNAQAPATSAQSPQPSSSQGSTVPPAKSTAAPSPSPIMTTFVVTLTRTMDPPVSSTPAAASVKARDLAKHKRLARAHAARGPSYNEAESIVEEAVAASVTKTANSAKFRR
ncbi:MAG: hypothetical protein M1836_006730 [Candelina mexicana]|nr:MAG: hypothetical protein M1836_006730 [Candelina mexicana]